MSLGPKVWHVGGEDVDLRIPLLLKLRERGFCVGAVGSQDSKPFDAHGIPYWRYPLKRWISPLWDRRAGRRLYELFSQYHPDIVHAFDTKPAILAPLAAQKAGIPGRIRTVTGMGYVFSSSSPLALALRPIYRHLQRKTSKATKVTIFQNHDDQTYFREKRLVPAATDILVPGSGIDMHEWESTHQDDRKLAELRDELTVDGRPVVTMVSRINRFKGVLEYLRAARDLRSQGSAAQFLLVGPRKSEGRLAVSQSLIQSYCTDVRYLGHRNDIRALLGISDIVVLPTYLREGVPRVLLEAGAMGIPLIATNTPGCKDVIQHGINGLLVPPRNSQALLEALSKLINSEQLRKTMGKASRKHIQASFSLAKVADAYAEIYDSVLQRVT